MSNDSVVKLIQPGTFNDLLTDVLRNGARALLTQAVEAEVAEFLGQYADLKTEAGLLRVVRHGHLPEREIMTGIGRVAVRHAARARPGSRCRRCGSYPLHTGDLAALCAAREEPGDADPDSVPEGCFDRRFRGSAGMLAGQGCPRPVGLHDRTAEGSLA